MTAPQLTAAAIVVNYGSHDLLERNLAELERAVRVVVVDNFSSTAERDALRELAGTRGWDLVAADGNPGFGAGVNLGARRAAELGARTMLLVNPDAVVSTGAARSLIGHVETQPEHVVAPRIVDSSGAVWFAGSEIVLRTGQLRDLHATPPQPAAGPVAPWLSGACLAIDVALFERLGGFADDYFLYWEDLDLSYRLSAAGATLTVRDDVTVVHDEGGTHGATEGPAKSPLYYRWNARNRLLFAAHNLPTRTLLAWLIATPAQSWQILLRGGRRQLIESPRPLLAITRGSLEGIALAASELCRRLVMKMRRRASARPYER